MSKLGIEIKWAAIITSLFLAWAFIEKSLGWHTDFSNAIVSTFLFYIILLVFYFIAFLDKKKNFYNNQWSIKDGFKFGMFLTGLLAIVNPLVQTIIYQSVSPDYFENIIQYKSAQTNNQYSADELAKYFNMKMYVRNGIFDTLSYGVIYSILLAYILKTKKYTAPVIVQKNNKKKK